MAGETTTIRTKNGMVSSSPRAPEGGSSPVWGGSGYTDFADPSGGIEIHRVTIDFPSAGWAHVEAWATGIAHPSSDDGGTGMKRQEIEVIHEGSPLFSSWRDVNVDTYWSITCVCGFAVPAGEVRFDLRVTGSHN